MTKEAVPIACPNTSNLEPVNRNVFKPEIFRCPITEEIGKKNSFTCPGDVDSINQCNQLQVSFSSGAHYAYDTDEQGSHVGGDHATLFEDTRF